MRIASGGNVLIGTITDVASSKLTIESTTQGVLVPRMTTTQIKANHQSITKQIHEKHKHTIKSHNQSIYK